MFVPFFFGLSSYFLLYFTWGIIVETGLKPALLVVICLAVSADLWEKEKEFSGSFRAVCCCQPVWCGKDIQVVAYCTLSIDMTVQSCNRCCTISWENTVLGSCQIQQPSDGGKADAGPLLIRMKSCQWNTDLFPTWTAPTTGLISTRILLAAWSSPAVTHWLMYPHCL